MHGHITIATRVNGDVFLIGFYNGTQGEQKMRAKNNVGKKELTF